MPPGWKAMQRTPCLACSGSISHTLLPSVHINCKAVGVKNPTGMDKLCKPSLDWSIDPKQIMGDANITYLLIAVLDVP